jgi:RNA polymerase sigma-70 factor (ECF subfamily)
VIGTDDALGDGRAVLSSQEAADRAQGLDLDLHLASLRRYARALAGRHVEADDLVQDCLERAIAKADRFQPGTNLRAWLFRIMHNLYIDRVRSQEARIERCTIEDAHWSLSYPASQTASVELRKVLEVVDELPPEQRSVLMMVALEGLKYIEVAEILDVPLGTVMSRLTRAREAVRNRVGESRKEPLRRVK